MIIINKPKKCGDCKFICDYSVDAWRRNPHYCCELRFFLYDEDYKVNPNTMDKKCPLTGIEPWNVIKD